MKSGYFAPAVVLTVVCLGGCDAGPNYSELKLLEVTGHVTLDGQPLPAATVRFEGPPGRFAEGRTDGNGRFRLLYDSNESGCTPGAKIVRILSGDLAEGAESDAVIEGADGQIIPPAQSLPAAYNSASILTANVSPGSQNFQFDLKSTP